MHYSYTGTAGTTALICYIDKKSQLIYTATLGDSEANIYRKIRGSLLSIPLSPIRDWNTDKKFIGSNADSITDGIKPRIHYQDSHMSISLNVSRSIGDKGCLLISQKPKVTQCNIHPNDTLILCCDGLKDFVPEATICQKIAQHQGSEQMLAQVLTNTSITTNLSTDNVTVIVIHIARGSE